MRKLNLLILIFCGLMVFALPLNSSANSPYSSSVKGEVIVKFKTSPKINSVTKERLRSYQFRGNKPLEKILAEHKLVGVEPLFSKEAAARKRSGATLRQARDTSRLHRLVFKKNADTNQIINQLKQLPEVEYAEPNFIGGMSYVPADPIFGNSQNDFDIINMSTAWDTQFGSSATLTVAVIDSGVETVHPELSAAMDLVNSYNVYDDDTLIFDDIGHGTRVAGIIAAAEGNAIGTAGIAFGCKIQSYDVASTTGFLTTADVAQAVNMANANGANIINMSLRFFGFSTALRNACDAAYANNILIVASAGNEGQAKLRTYPAGLSSVIGVGCVLDDGTTRAFWSNYNDIVPDLVEIVAPGETVYSTIPGEQYNGTLGNGTSFAAPMVSGAAALLMSQNPFQSVPAIRDHLNKTATVLPNLNDPPGWFGNGLLDVANAVNTPMAPIVEIEQVIVDDSVALSALNDADGAIDILETVQLEFVLKSIAADATNVVGTLTSNDIAVGVIQSPNVNIGNFRFGETFNTIGIPIGPILITASDGARKIDFRLTLTGDAGFNQAIDFQADMEYEVPVQGVLPGVFTSNRTWRITGNSNFVGITTIEPGTTIKLDNNVSLFLDPSSSLTADGFSTAPIIFKPSTLSGSWGSFTIPNQASAASFKFCEFERGDTIFADNDGFVIQDSRISNMSGTGLHISLPSNGPDIERVISENNGAEGILAGGRKVIECTSNGNSGVGIGQANSLIGCTAILNRNGGMQGESATDCVATSNTIHGMVITNDVSNSFANANSQAGIICAAGTVTTCTAINNGGPGIHLQNSGLGISGCRALGNGGGGIIAEVSLIENCEAEFNGVFGIQGNAFDTEARNCRVNGNLFGTFSNVLKVTDCVVTDNLLDGVGGFTNEVTGSIISGNQGFGVTGSVVNLSNSAVYGNQDTGALNVGNVTNCWLVNNFGGGFESTQFGVITNTSILDNSPFGVNSALQVNNNNIFNNEIFQAEDTNGSAAQTRDYTGNFWGAANTLEITANPPFTDRTFINDFYDGEANTLDIWAPALSQLPVPNIALTPTFLLSISPNIMEAVQNDPAKVQKTTFTLTFSKDMDTSKNPVVSFGVSPPFTTHVVLPEGANGWVDARTWQGFFDIGNGDGNGLNTYRVAGAVDADGFEVPEDTTRLFFIDTGSLSANNGLAAGLSTTRMRVSWSSNNQPPGTKGFNIRRKALSDEGAMLKVNPASVASSESQYDDDGLTSNTTYLYVVDIVDSNDHSTQWTPTFIGTTFSVDPPVIDTTLLGTRFWDLLE